MTTAETVDTIYSWLGRWNNSDKAGMSEETKNAAATAFSWIGRMTPIQRKLVLEMADLRRADKAPRLFCKPCGLQNATKTRPALVDPYKTISMFPTREGWALVCILAEMDADAARKIVLEQRSAAA